MTEGDQPRRRRRRAARPDAEPAAVVALLRATSVAGAEAGAEIVGDALLMAERYVWEDPQRGVELLFGVSLWAVPAPNAEARILVRFPAAPFYLRFHVAALETAGVPVLATGADPDHYEAQLVTGVREAVPDPLDDSEVQSRLREMAARFVAIGGESRPNPAYDGRRPRAIQDQP